MEDNTRNEQVSGPMMSQSEREMYFREMIALLEESGKCLSIYHELGFELGLLPDANPNM